MIHPNMTLLFHESVLAYATRDEACGATDPAMYVDQHGLVKIESKLSPHDGQLMVADLEYNDWLDDPDLTPADLLRLTRDAIRDALMP